MATAAQEESERSRLVGHLETIAEAQPDVLARTSELGTAFDFSEGVPEMARLRELFSSLKAISLAPVPHATLKALADVAQQAVNVVAEIEAFDPGKHANPAQQRDGLLNQLRTAYERAYAVVTPNVSYALRTGAEVSGIEQQAREMLDEVRGLRDQVEGELESAKDEAESILMATRQAAAETGVTQHAEYFESEGSDQKQEADKWLKRTAWLGATTAALAIVALVLWLRLASSLDLGTAIQVGIAKLLFFSVLFFALTYSGRNFLAHKHNETLNRHRRNALQTFEAFVKATDDSSTKNAVLIQATQAIFAPQSTGYLTKEGSEAQMPQIMEVIRSVGSGQPGD